MAKTLVELIQEVESTIAELKENEKKTGKALKALEEEQRNTTANIKMWEDVLKSLNGTKKKEIEAIMNDKPAKKRKGPIKPKKVIMKDENGTVVAEYSSQTAAAKDLGVQQSIISSRMRKMQKEEQIEKFGFVLEFA